MRLLQTEIQVARPQVVAFFTGVSHDYIVRSLYAEIEIVDLGEGLAEVKGLPGVVAAYRCEHPRTLRMRQHWSVLDRLAKLARDSVQSHKT
jgi:hypothetical protein